jgi:superfamily II DNA/RNA helicase
VIFSATKAYSEELADKLSDQGYSAACLHGDMPQSWRNRTLNDLRRGRIKIWLPPTLLLAVSTYRPSPTW